MKKGRRVALLAAMILLSGAASAAAQNHEAAPLFGTLTMRAGFTPDPSVTVVQAGGGVSVYSLRLGLGRRCGGYINADAPDVRFRFESTDSYLRIGARASADTTLLIRMPDGSWNCVDDTVGFNPVFSQENAQSGEYNIWVGTYAAAIRVPAEVIITEYQRDDMFAGASGATTSVLGASTNTAAGGALNPSHAPRNAELNLGPGFMPDPQRFSTQVGGVTQVSASNLTSANGGPCRGNVSGAAPDFRINMAAGSEFLRFFVRSNSDTTLVIHAPDNQWYCEDDSLGTNPVVDIQAPQAGTYSVWIGIFNSTNAQPAEFGISELRSVNP